jgi:acyl-CoA-binding protein
MSLVDEFNSAVVKRKKKEQARGEYVALVNDLYRQYR